MPNCGLAALYGYDLTVFPGHPAHLAAHLHNVPAVNGGADMLEHRSVSNSGVAPVFINQVALFMLFDSADKKLPLPLNLLTKLVPFNKTLSAHRGVVVFGK